MEVGILHSKWLFSRKMEHTMHPQTFVICKILVIIAPLLDIVTHALSIMAWFIGLSHKGTYSNPFIADFHWK